MKKHKVIVTVVLLVSIIVGSSLVFDSMKKNSFPYKYQDILTSYLGDYTIEKKAKNKADKTERSMSDSWDINYGKQLKDNMLIYDEKSFFTQLQDTYVSHHFLQLSEKINAKDSILYLRNAFMAIPYAYTSDNCEKLDDQIAKNYSQYYPQSFCINEGYNIDHLFTEKKSPLFFVFVCNNKETANRFISEIKNVNAIIIITSDVMNEDSLTIEANKIENDSDKYMFVYHGKIIEDGQKIMGLNKDYGDNENGYEQGTIIYNFNHFIKDMYNQNEY
ncbi:hypothetical protein [Longibaculum muris]|uniref:hypothetical protein n=1 Tax=Longibaculum muris TaxID=1796628 RepID=UPI002942F318|nr:hypothetical protein [Longibaculum muris]